MPAKINQIQTYVPGDPIDNTAINNYLTCEEKVEDEWMIENTGIRHRHFSSKEETMLDMIQACHGENLDILDVDTILLVSMSDLTRGKLARSLKDIYSTEVISLNHGCAGFVFGLEEAKRLIEEEGQQKIALITVEQISRISDWSNRSVSATFGDACAITGISQCEEGDFGEIMKTKTNINPIFDSNNLCVDYENKAPVLRMHGPLLKALAMRGMTSMIKAVSENPQDLDELVLHQGNKVIIETIVKKLKFKNESKTVLDKYANTSSTGIPLVLADKNQEMKEGLWGIASIGASTIGAGYKKAGGLVRSFKL